MNLTDLLILGLAGWRLTSLIVWEAGPWDILFRLRHRLGVRYTEDNQRYSDKLLGQIVICPWCFSMWVGLALGIAWLLEPVWTSRFCGPFAISAMSVVLEKAVSHGEG